MDEYQFSYDDGTMCVFELSETQFKGVVKSIRESKSYYMDDKNGLILKLSHIRSISLIPDVPVQEGESYDPGEDPEIKKYLELARLADEYLEDGPEDESDYRGGMSL